MQKDGIDITTKIMEPKEYQDIQNHLIEQHPILKGQYQATYQRILSYSRLTLNKQIGYRNVRIYENQYIHQIYSLHNQQQKLPHLVFLHGYGGTSMTSIRMFQYFYTKFQFHALDQYGLGYSSRGNYSESFNGQQTKEYYINAVQQWRKNLKIQKFILVGHSFGGYLAACYAKKHPQRINKLILLSPVGFNKKFRNQEHQEQTCRSKAFTCLAQKPSAAMTNFFFGSRIINSIVANRLKLQAQEKQDWKKYFIQFSSQATSSETGFYKLFTWPLEPLQSIEEMIKQQMFKFPIDFYFGDSDWMSRNGIQTILKSFKNISQTIIPNAGHQLVFDNPQAVCNSILLKMQ